MSNCFHQLGIVVEYKGFDVFTMHRGPFIKRLSIPECGVLFIHPSMGDVIHEDKAKIFEDDFMSNNLDFSSLKFKVINYSSGRVEEVLPHFLKQEI